MLLHKNGVRVIFAGVLTSIIFSSTLALARATTATWNPEVTEKLVKLPQSRIEKSLKRDFAKSALAEAIQDVSEEINLKLATLNDLGEALGLSAGAIKDELRHQLLVEKRNYINLVKKSQELRRRHLEKKKSFYDKLRQKIKRGEAANTKDTQLLVKQQTEARERFNKGSHNVDLRVFSTFDAPNSEYSREYGRNLSAANALMAAIKNHPMNKEDTPEKSEDKAAYLLRLVAQSDASLAIIQQENEILGYMAKLVALDGEAFAEELRENSDEIQVGQPSRSPLSSVLSHFIK